MTDVAIVEPHYDDAWLSLGGTILIHPSVRFRIVSVSRDDEHNPIDRTRDLVDHVENLSAVALELEDLGWRRRDVMRRAKERGLDSPLALFLAENRLDEAALAARILEATAGASLILMPLGLFHPMHDALAALDLRAPVGRYFEYPYGVFRGWQAALRERTEGLHERRVDVSEVAADKLRIFEAVYPDQRYVLDLPQCPVHLRDVAEERIYADDASRLDALGGERPSSAPG